jgi:DNA repair exonuclease SbcCD ATPase subunit
VRDSSALRSEVSFLRDHRDEWRAVEARAAARLSEHTVTLAEFDSVRQHVGELERKLAQADGQAAEIVARRGATASASLAELIRRYAELASRAEQAEARVRRLEPWQLQMTGGIVAQAPIDWYGLVELSVNLGVFARNRQEERHAEARMDEVRHAPYELAARVQRLRDQTAAALEEARQELTVVEHDLATLADVHQALDKSDAANILQARDAVAVEELSAESDGVFLRALIGSLNALLEDGHV